MERYQVNNHFEEELLTNVRKVLEFVLRLKWWIVFSIAVTMSLACLYIRIQTPVYERTTWVLLNNSDANGNAELNLLTELTGRSASKKIDNEIFILKSPSIMSKVVSELGINSRYYRCKWPVGKVEYYNNNPFELTVTVNPLYPDGMQPGSLSLKFKNEGTGFTVRELFVNGAKVNPEQDRYNYGDSIPMGAFSLRLNVLNNNIMADGGKYICTWHTPINAAYGIVNRLDAAVMNNNKNSKSDMIAVTLLDNIPQRADDILNSLTAVANQECHEYRNISARNVISFIDQRLAVISSELGEAENDYKNYQSDNRAVNLESQTQMAMNSDMDYQKQYTEVELQLQILNMINSYLHEVSEADYRVVPANVGLTDAGMNSIISNYNALVSERNRLVANSSETNPRVQSMNGQLEDSKKTIELSIANLIKAYTIRKNELSKVLSSNQRKMANIPQQQFELQQRSRKMEVIEPLFQLLQQRREEAQIDMYSEVDNFRVIEASFGSSVPVKPNTKLIFILAFALGFLLPPVIMHSRSLFKRKVETKHDVESYIKAPILACLPKNDMDHPLISMRGRDTTTESFRILRTNVLFMEGVKVLQVTSSIRGEGKCFVASNLALSLAHAGRKVILVGMDLRNPTLHKVFKGVKNDPYKSVIGCLMGACTNIDDAIVPSRDADTLDLMLAGGVPSNPTELLSMGRHGELISYLRDRYDYVIIDSAPYLPVSDSSLINAFVDATLYVVRADYTDIKILTEANEVIRSHTRPVKNASIVLNALDVNSGKFKYGYGPEYGYVAGYGYGYAADSK